MKPPPHAPVLHQQIVKQALYKLLTSTTRGSDQIIALQLAESLHIQEPVMSHTMTMEPVQELSTLTQGIWKCQ
jgi:hypothetical protein